MNKLSIHVRSGLCNRLRVILSAIAYCELTNRELWIYWQREDENAAEGMTHFEAGLSDLFDHPFREVSLEEHNACGRSIKQDEIKLDTPGDLHIRTINMFPGVIAPDDLPHKAESHHFLASREHYAKPFSEYWDPKMNLRDDVCDVIFDGEMIIDEPFVVGVQIRSKCPNYETPRRSPVEKFIARMRLFPDDALFFLSTDKASVRDQLEEAFPSRILQLPQTYVYDKQGIQTRLAELYLLAQCRHILGSYISSFSEFAGWLAGSRYSACYLWPADAGDRYEDVGLWSPA